MTTVVIVSIGPVLKSRFTKEMEVEGLDKGGSAMLERRRPYFPPSGDFRIAPKCDA